MVNICEKCIVNFGFVFVCGFFARIGACLRAISDLICVHLFTLFNVKVSSSESLVLVNIGLQMSQSLENVNICSFLCFLKCNVTFQDFWGLHRHQLIGSLMTAIVVNHFISSSFEFYNLWSYSACSYKWLKHLR